MIDSYWTVLFMYQHTQCEIVSSDGEVSDFRENL